MPWKTMDIREQRVRFVVAANRREKSMAELCREFGISRPVGYEWLVAHVSPCTVLYTRLLVGSTRAATRLAPDRAGPTYSKSGNDKPRAGWAYETALEST